jgi:hypothetical protein
MTARQRKDSSEKVQMEAELSPLPPEEERWWWRERVHHHAGWHGVGYISSDDRFAIIQGVQREALESAARQFRDAVLAAVAEYPVRYRFDQEAMDDIRTEGETAERRQLEADQAILDRVMGE